MSGYRERRLRRRLLHPLFAAVYVWTLYRLRKRAELHVHRGEAHP